MRRRRIAFMRRAIVMAAPTFITTCMGQTPTPDATRTPSPAVQASQAPRPAGQPAGRMAQKNGRDAQPGSHAETSRRQVVAGPRPTGAR